MCSAIIHINQNLPFIYHTLKDETGIVTSTLTTAATVSHINVYATMATAIITTTAESKMCGQH